MIDHSSAFRRTALILTAAGALPFLGFSVATATLEAPTNATAGLWLQTYAAVILSFLGGIRWGMSLTSDRSRSSTLILSVMPALLGWVILPFAIILLPNPNWYLALAALFVIQLAWDWTSTRVPAWFKPMRLGATVAAAGSLVFAWAVPSFGL
ncbi:DUF3429 domain-containing protein [Henriciella sp. AS95]|uniref:DUF3429 domain-containing protein n=1 Tax=Henriciella sp. AS95 TaxID=3135782 RepID=UPI0031807912